MIQSSPTFVTKISNMKQSACSAHHWSLTQARRFVLSASIYFESQRFVFSGFHLNISIGFTANNRNATMRF